MNNFEHLKAMSVEEMAEFLEIIPRCGRPSTYTIGGFCIDDGFMTKSQWLEWLKLEVEDGNGTR